MGAKNQTKEIRSIWVYSNLPISATRPLGTARRGWELPRIALHWLVDSNILKCFEFLWSVFLHRSCWERFIMVFRIHSHFSVKFLKMKLKFCEGMGTSLIDRMLVFLRWEFHWFGVSSSLKWTRSGCGGWLLPALSPWLANRRGQIFLS